MKKPRADAAGERRVALELDDLLGRESAGTKLRRLAVRSRRNRRVAARHELKAIDARQSAGLQPGMLVNDAVCLSGPGDMHKGEPYDRILQFTEHAWLAR